MPTHSRPPQVDGHSVPHDSTIAQPGIPNGQGKGKGCIGQHRRLGLLLPTFPAQRKDSPFVTYDSLQAVDICNALNRPGLPLQEPHRLKASLIAGIDVYVRFL